MLNAMPNRDEGEEKMTDNTVKVLDDLVRLRSKMTSIRQLISGNKELLLSEDGVAGLAEFLRDWGDDIDRFIHLLQH